MDNKAFTLPPNLAEKVDRIQKEMGLDDPGLVITKAIELLDISIGRKVILEEKDKKRSLHIDDLQDYNQTFNLEEDGDNTSSES
jgi:hypothetical protein